MIDTPAGIGRKHPQNCHSVAQESTTSTNPLRIPCHTVQAPSWRQFAAFSCIAHGPTACGVPYQHKCESFSIENHSRAHTCEGHRQERNNWEQFGTAARFIGSMIASSDPRCREGIDLRCPCHADCRFFAHGRFAMHLALPSGVLGPVHIPPCHLQRPFGNATARHGLPVRVLALHSSGLSPA